MKLIWADSGYKQGGFVDWVKATLGWTVEIVEHPWSGIRSVWVPEGVEPDWEKIRPSGFHVLKWRWIVERTFAWLSTWRRRALDYEVLPSSEEAPRARLRSSRKKEMSFIAALQLKAAMIKIANSPTMIRACTLGVIPRRDEMIVSMLLLASFV